MTDPSKKKSTFWNRPPQNALPPLAQSSPWRQFLEQESLAAVILLLAAFAALILANSPWNHFYHDYLHALFGFEFGETIIHETVHFWVNDGLMVIFFFVVGLEIKRELVAGELASFRRAILPAFAALGGMVCPALIFVAFNAGEGSISGWGIPMATDIAFAAGCIALLSKRVPTALSVLLIALAIVDDLGAVLVIALFYTEQLSMSHLGIGLGFVVIAMICGRFGVRQVWIYFLLLFRTWIFFLQSGVHATIAGVLMAFSIPISARYESGHFPKRTRTLMDHFHSADQSGSALLISARQQHTIRHMTHECRLVESPLQRMEHTLQPISTFLIMPIFAFTNAGVHLDFSQFGDMVMTRVAFGVFLGLFIGKQIGVTLFSWVAVKLGWAELPRGITWPQIYGMSLLAGIGFTMALFVNELAFKAGPDGAINEHLDEAKIAIFMASGLAGIIGLGVLRAVCRTVLPSNEQGPAHH